MCNAFKHGHKFFYLFTTSFFKAGQKTLSREPSLLSQRFPACPLLPSASHGQQLAHTSLVGGKGILRPKQVVITANKFSLARPKANPGYLSNSVPPSTAFLFNEHQVFMHKAWNFFSSRTKISHKETTQTLASNTLKDILVSIRSPKITMVRV